jgi:ADP-heptose:LPS heptosyltransferase
MKITISSPDGLGDFILRVPMIRALLDDGHRLQMLLRRPAADLAAAVFPGIERLEIGADPYHAETRRKRNPFRAEQEAIRNFGPDLYVASLFALNFFDEVWFEHDRGRVPVAGFSTREDFWPSGTIADPRRLAEAFRINVQVPVALPELEKNRLLAAAILGKELSGSPPRLEPGAAALEAGRKVLRRHGLNEGEYWIACVGGRSGLRMKDWGEENWREFLSTVLAGDVRPVVFLGNTKEWESIEKIRSDRFRSVNLSSEPPPIPVSLALAAMSCGYVGRDSGVMHMAAASGRPVLAAFGGGHWGRFLPSSGPAVVVTQAMSCRMCDFACPHDRPHCIAGIRLDAMLAGWERLSHVEGVEVIEQAIDGELDTVNADDAKSFAMAHAGELMEREAGARRSPWQRIFPGWSRKKRK